MQFETLQSAKPPLVVKLLREALDRHFLLNELNDACKQTLVATMTELQEPSDQVTTLLATPSLYRSPWSLCRCRPR